MNDNNNNNNNNNNTTTNDDDTNDDNTIPDNPPVVSKMTPRDNPVSKIKNGSTTQSEALADTLEWCRRASQLEKCPQLTGGGKYNGDTACTCLHAL
jgi:hypothetical protein